MTGNHYGIKRLEFLFQGMVFFRSESNKSNKIWSKFLFIALNYLIWRFTYSLIHHFRNYTIFFSDIMNKRTHKHR